LDVSNPTLVRDSDIANPSGANAQRMNVVWVMNMNMPFAAEEVARITDEWVRDYPVGGYDYLDQRKSEAYEQQQGTSDSHLGAMDQVYWSTSLAIGAVRAYTPDSLKPDFLGQLYATRGYVALQAAEDICPGFPLNDVAVDNQPLYSGPLTTDSALVIANAALDSAVKYATDSMEFVALARVTKGRALLDQGKYAEAAAIVGPVATSTVYRTSGTFNRMAGDMNPGAWQRGSFNYAVGNHDGGNGLDFVSANDPRVPLVLGGARATNTADTLYKTTKYTRTSQIVLASGIEARLIEAEAALHAGDPSWLTLLNTLRETAISPALPDLVDPGTPSTQVDLIYRERAFWLFGTGRRLGDLRRLIRNYGRSAESVFPTGPFFAGGTYGTATAIPFILASQQQSNPHITSGCTTR